MEDISSVLRVAFADQKKHLASAIAESEGLFSQRKETLFENKHAYAFTFMYLKSILFNRATNIYTSEAT